MEFFQALFVAHHLHLPDHLAHHLLHARGKALVEHALQFVDGRDIVEVPFHPALHVEELQMGDAPSQSQSSSTTSSTLRPSVPRIRRLPVARPLR